MEHTTVDWALAYDLYRTGRYSVRKIADFIGCDESSIRYRIKTHNWHPDAEFRDPENGPMSTDWQQVLEARDRHRQMTGEGIIQLRLMSRQIESKLAAKAEHSVEELRDLLDLHYRWGRCMKNMVGLERESYNMQGTCSKRERQMEKYKEEERILDEAYPASSRDFPHVPAPHFELGNESVEPKPEPEFFSSRTDPERGLIARFDSSAAPATSPTTEELRALTKEFEMLNQHMQRRLTCGANQSHEASQPALAG